MSIGGSLNQNKHSSVNINFNDFGNTKKCYTVHAIFKDDPQSYKRSLLSNLTVWSVHSNTNRTGSN